MPAASISTPEAGRRPTRLSRFRDRSRNRSSSSDASLSNIIPFGTVERLRGDLERRAAAQHQESDTVLIARAREYADRSYGSSITYEERLRVAEIIGLSGLPSSLAGFVQAHDEMAHSINRTRRK